MVTQSNCLISGSNHLQFKEMPISSIKIPERELRIHPKTQIKKIATSLESFGWMSPILVASDGTLITGVARLRAAQHLGLETAPVLEVHHLNDAEIRAYRIADNRLSEESNWNRNELRLELSELLDLELDLELTGFEVGEIDVLFDDAAEEASGTANLEVPEAVVSRPGDVWKIGPHILICGDALVPKSYEALSDIPLAACFTDPPYNVPIANNVSGLGQTKHADFVQASGELTEPEFAAFLHKAHAQILEKLQPGGVVFSCMDWRSIASLLAEGQNAGLELINLVVWDKGIGGMGALYRSQHELIALFKKPGGQHRNNVALGKHGRNRTNVWSYPGFNGGSQERDKMLALHPTVKPTKLVIDAIKDVTKHGDTVLDIFGGSGTTMVAAHKCQRHAALIELDPKYVDVIIHRMETECGLTATHVDSGLSFENLKASRTPDTANPQARSDAADGSTK